MSSDQPDMIGRLKAWKYENMIRSLDLRRGDGWSVPVKQGKCIIVDTDHNGNVTGERIAPGEKGTRLARIEAKLDQLLAAVFAGEHT